ncbi:MAG: hypothetical protein GY701_17880 [Sulfitobacter sp.]|nr:hypothetical protein [Sulfitobacter sp.]
MTMERLSMVAPELAERIQAVDDEAVLREAALVAAETVVVRSEVDDDLVQSALDQLRSRVWSEGLRIDLQRRAEELDELYWDLQDRFEAGDASQDAYLAAFGRARSVSAVGCALDTDPIMAALEAAYEAHCAFVDGSGVIEKVSQVLSAS